MIDGGKGEDTFNLTVEGTGTAAGAGAFPSAQVKNVEKFVVRDVATAASAYDFAPIEGETEVWSDMSTNAAAVAFNNLGTGTVVGVRGNGVAKALSNVTFSMAKASDAVNIAVDGGVNNTVPLTITNTNTGAAKAATITSTGGNNVLGAVTLAASNGNSVKDLTVNAESNLTATLVATDYATDAVLTVKGEGAVTLRDAVAWNGKEIVAGDHSGGLSVSTGANVKTVVTGSGNDTVSLSASLASGGTVSLGAGDDVFVATAGDVNGAKKVDGGDGTDSIAAGLINAANAANLVNFELIDITTTSASALDVELMSGSKITGLTHTGVGTAGATEVKNVASGSTLTITGTDTTNVNTIGVKGAATSTSDSFKIVFAGTGDGGDEDNPIVYTSKLKIDGVETLNVTSSGTGFVENELEIADDKLQSLTISGDKDLTLTFAATTGTDAAPVYGVSNIEASGATGGVTVTIPASPTFVISSKDGLTITTGSGNDFVDVSQAAKISTGAGDDEIVVNDAVATTLDGGAGVDKFDVKAAVATNTTVDAGMIITTINGSNLTEGDSILFTNTAAKFVSTKVALGSTVQNLDNALTAAMGAATDGTEVLWFQYGSDTYMVQDVDGGNTVTAGDLVVKLTGTVDLSTATFNATDHAVVIG